MFPAGAALRGPNRAARSACRHHSFTHTHKAHQQSMPRSPSTHTRAHGRPVAATRALMEALRRRRIKLNQINAAVGHALACDVRPGNPTHSAARRSWGLVGVCWCAERVVL